jgi:hypothetical protein
MVTTPSDFTGASAETGVVDGDWAATVETKEKETGKARANAKARRFFRMKNLRKYPSNQPLAHVEWAQGAMNSIVQEKAGGPRAGSGAAVREAMWAAGMLCST